MSRIVKSAEVVDDRSVRNDAMELPFTGAGVLKNGLINGYGQNGARMPRISYTRDEYRDELNKMKIQLDEAKEELRLINIEIALTKEEAKKQRELAKQEKERLEKLKLDESILDDGVFTARLNEAKELYAKAEKEGTALLELAHVEADKIKEEAAAIRDAAKGEGYQEGYAEGYQLAVEKGYEEALASFEADAQPKLDELSEVIAALTSYGSKLMKEKEEEFVELATAIAGKVIGKTIKKDSKFILDMLRETITKNHRENYINITLSEDMLPVKVAASDEIISLIQEMANNISVFVERDSEDGICVVETPKGVTDMSVNVQLKNIEGMLKEE